MARARNIRRELAALRRARRRELQLRRGDAGMGGVSDTAALAAIVGLFVGVPALIGYLGRRGAESEGWAR